MTNIIAKYITNWKSDAGDTKSIAFDVLDTPVSRAWIKVIKRKLEQEDVEPKDYSQHGTFPGFDDKHLLNSKILENVKIAQQMVPELQWPTDVDDITRDGLNVLHEHFHEIEEKTFRGLLNNNLTEEQHCIKRAFMDINHHIHEIETILLWESLPEEKKQNRRAYRVMNFGRYDLDLREPVTPELREFWRSTYFPNQKPVQLILGYATIGKNMYHCTYDNDVQVVKDDMVRPQIDIGGEAKLVVHEGWYARTPDDVERINGEVESKITNFIKQNELEDLVDINDKNHIYGQQPQLGIISDEHDDWTMADYYEVCSKYNMISVELEEF
jgi:hypothetical protein